MIKGNIIREGLFDHAQKVQMLDRIVLSSSNNFDGSQPYTTPLTGENNKKGNRRSQRLKSQDGVEMESAMNFYGPSQDNSIFMQDPQSRQKLKPDDLFR